MLAALSLTTAACGGSSDSDGSAATAPSEPASETTTSLIVTGEGGTPALAGDPGEELVVTDIESDVSTGSDGETATTTTVDSATDTAVSDFQADVAGDMGVDVPAAEDDAVWTRIESTDGKVSFEAPAELSQAVEGRNLAGQTRLAATSQGYAWASSLIEVSGFTAPDTASSVLAKVAANNRGCTAPGTGVGSEVRPFDDGRYTGVQQTWTGCPDGASLVIVALDPVDGSSPSALFISLLHTTADVANLGRAVSTFALT